MKIIHPGDPERLEGGIKTSMRHQRQCLRKQEIEYTEKYDPGADILHVNMLSPGDIYRVMRAKKDGIPVVIHTHEIGENFAGSFRFSTYLAPFARRYVDAFYRCADLLICPSEYAAEVLDERGIDTEKKVISNGIDPERFRDLEDFGFEKEGFTVINVSIVFERKGLTDFIDTGRELPDTEFRWFGPNFGRWMTGGSTEKKIKNSPENVDFPGYADDVRDAFASGDVFFFPTKSETEGLSVLEAAYCGLPIVVRDIPVYESIFTDEKDCLKAEDVEGFARSIERLKEDSKLRERIADNAKALAEQHTLDRIAEKLENAYNFAVKNR
ncbi:MAG: glycosyltransferase family 4 protein [Candidatus Nanohaloarchaea archaeon]